MDSQRAAAVPLARKLGELLVEAGLVEPGQVERALIESRQSGESLGRVLLKREWLTEEQLGLVLGAQAGTDYVKVSERGIDLTLANLLPRDFQAQRKVLPLARRGDVLEVAMVHPNDVATLDEIRLLTGLKPRPLVTTSREFEDAFLARTGDLSGQVSDAIASLRQEAAEGATEPSRLVDEVSIEDHPVVRLLNSLLGDAIARGASDVHLEARERQLRVRFRIDGLMSDAAEIPKDLEPAALSRLKVMASLDIAERRLPQDGRARLVVDGRPFDLRINFMPNIHGEKAVVRILRPAMLIGGLDTLGLHPGDRDAVRSLIDSPHGIVLATGPTGSGKTTSLYSALYELNTPERNVLTVEDPVEYPLEGISQTQVNLKAGLSFAGSLRAMLRQDPDVVMVGEIRMQETLDAAVYAALTGHLVLASIHTNDAASTPLRLLEMGLPSYLLTSALRGIVAQRLVRRLCSHCRVPASSAGLPPVLVAGPLFTAAGCSRCRGTGFAGRVGLFEVLPLAVELQELIGTNAPAYKVREAATRLGFGTMALDGLRKVQDGTTTPAEVARALGSHWTDDPCLRSFTAP